MLAVTSTNVVGTSTASVTSITASLGQMFHHFSKTFARSSQSHSETKWMHMGKEEEAYEDETGLEQGRDPTIV